MSNHSAALPEGYPLYFKGDPKLIRQIKLTLSANLSFPKSIPIMIPFVPKQKQSISTIPLLEPIIYLQIIDDSIREQVVKGKHQLKPDTFYIYYPTQFRVDQKIYKGLVKNFQALLDEVPRNIKPYLHRLILWEEGKGDNSIEVQKHKINDSLSEISKQLIQSKLSSFAADIKQYQSQPSTPKSLLHIFLLKNKLACLYNHLNLRQFAHDLLSDVWNQMMINFRCLMKLSPSNKFGSIQKLDFPEDIPKLPYTFDNTNDILGYFQSNHSTAYLRIVTHAFMKYFDYCLALGMKSNGLAKLKYFMDFVLNNVLVLNRRNQWAKKQMSLFDLARNLWAVEVITNCVKNFSQSQQYQNKKKEQQNSANLNENRLEDIAKYRVSIISMLRNSVQRIGLILYSFNNYSIFPTTIPLQLKFIYQKIKKLKQPWHETKKSVESIRSEEMEEIVQKTSSMIRREQFVCEIPEVGQNQLKLRELISDKMVPSQKVTKLLVSFQAYSQVYLEVLQQMYQALKDSPFKKVAQSLKLTLQRATIMLGDWQDYQKVHDENYQFENRWPQLHAIEQLYRLFFYLVKFLSNELPNLSLMTDQVIGILKDPELNFLYHNKQNDGLQEIKSQICQKVEVFEIASAVSQVLDASGVKLTLARAHSVMLIEPNAQGNQCPERMIKIRVQSCDIGHIILKAKNWRLLTTQLMLHQGEKSFNLTEIKYRQYKTCKQCPQSSVPQMGITAILEMEQKQEQYLFYINKIQFDLPINQSHIKLQMQVKQSKQEILYKINCPHLSLLTQKQPIVFAETWAPLLVRIANVGQGVQLVGAKVQIRNVFNRNSGKLKEQSVQFKHDEKQMGNIKISNIIYLESQTDKQQGQYLETDKEINKKLKNAHNISIFALSAKPDKIQRKSKRHNQIHETNDYLHIEFTFRSLQNNKPFTLCLQTGNIIIRPLLQLNYIAVQTCQEFQVTNLLNLKLLIWEDQQTDASSNQEPRYLCQLDEGETVCTESRFLIISCAKYQKMKVNINLNDWFDSQHLLTQKNNTFRIWYRSQYNYRIFKPIQVQSQIVGQIEVPYLEETVEQGLELVGKIKGNISYISNPHLEKQGENKCINLWMIPVKTGNIILPEIWIDGKKGIWVNSLITNVQTAQ